MPRNIELKARIQATAAVHATAAEISQAPAEVLEQTDTFFPVPQGRLKLREIPDQPGELIFYERQDMPGPCASSYRIYRSDAPRELRDILAGSLGVRGIVRKTRHLYRTEGLRIHIDDVEGLGTYFEIEILLGPGEEAAEAQERADARAARFDIASDDLVDVAYIYLLEEAAGGGLPESGSVSS